MYDPHATSSTFSATVTQYGGYRQALDGSPSLNDGFGPSQIATAAKNAPIDTFIDDFTTADSTKWTFSAATTVTGGQLVETPDGGYSGTINGTAAYDLTGSEAVVELVQRANLGNGSTETYFGLYTTAGNVNDNSLLFDVTGANLIASRNIAGVRVTTSTVAYDATAHRWLRIRESGGSALWDTSPDRTTWTNQGTWTPTFPVTALYVFLGTGFSGTEPSPGTAIWDNLNTVPVGTAATASGSITLGGSATASAASTTTGSISLGGTAAPAAAATSTGSISLGGSASPAAPVTTVGSIALGGTATARAAATTTGAITLGGTATAQAVASSAGTITLSGTASPQAATTTAGSITLAGTSTPAAIATATGSVTLGGSATARAATTAAGTVTLAGTASSGAAPVPATASGGISLGGSSTARAATTVSGTVTLGGTVTPVAASSSLSGVIVLAGASTGQAPDSSAGTITLGGVVTAAVPATVAGLITLSGLANGTAGAPPRDITLTVSAGRSRGLAATGLSRALAATGRSRAADVTAEQSRHLSATGRSRTLTATPQE